MGDITAVIETMEHRWMRAWVNRDAKALKSLTASSAPEIAKTAMPNRSSTTKASEKCGTSGAVT